MVLGDSPRRASGQWRHRGGATAFGRTTITTASRVSTIARRIFAAERDELPRQRETGRSGLVDAVHGRSRLAPLRHACQQRHRDRALSRLRAFPQDESRHHVLRLRSVDPQEDSLAQNGGLSSSSLTFGKAMAHFDDLSDYRYANHAQPGVVHVGWLSRGHPYTQGTVPSRIVEKMKHLAQEPVELYRGYHVCELCEMPAELRERPFAEQWEKWAQFRKSNGEIRVSRTDVTYAAPVLITHYIETHGYRPPAEFLKALEEEPNSERSASP